MDENTEALAPTDAEIDAAWNEEDTPEEDEGGQEEKPEADQPKEEPAEKPTEEKPKEEAKPDAKPDAAESKPAEAEQPPTFTLKHLDETRTVGKDEIVKLAQQGMDYERIRTERDQLREYRKEADPALTLLKTYAENSGMTVQQYVDSLRERDLKSAGLNEQTAKAQIAVEKREAALKAREQEKAEADKKAKDEDAAKTRQEQERAAREEAKRTSMSRFLKTYPDVKADKIPQEVWHAVTQGEDLTAAYTMHRNKQLEAELAAERKNKENAKKSTGSMTTKGAGKQDEIDKWWNEE